MKQCIKKGLFIIITVTIVILFLNKSDLESERNMRKEMDLVGEWKVTEYLTAVEGNGMSYFYPNYLGRSIIIEPNRIIGSVDYWPNSLGYKVMQYRYMDVAKHDACKLGTANDLGEIWNEKFEGQDMITVSFGMSKESKDGWTFFVTEDKEVLCAYWDKIYYIERFKNAETDLNIDQLYGEWKVKRLVSYQDGWKGNNELWQWSGFPRRYTEEEGANFYPVDYIGNTIAISSNSIEIYDAEKLLERHVVSNFNSNIIDKYEYQNKKRIHDELGITNEEIQVITGDMIDSSGILLDGEIVVVNEAEVIVKIYQGWYLLEKLSAERMELRNCEENRRFSSQA